MALSKGKKNANAEKKTASHFFLNLNFKRLKKKIFLMINFKNRQDKRRVTVLMEVVKEHLGSLARFDQPEGLR